MTETNDNAPPPSRWVQNMVFYAFIGITGF